MNWSTLNTMVWAGYYVAFISWAVLAVIVVRHLIKKDFQRLKVALLYVLNSSTFILAWGMLFRLALIVVAPIADTREHSIDILWGEANRYFSDHLQFAVITILGFGVFNVVYMKYVVHQPVLRHSLILLAADTLVLLSAVYLSVASYYTGLLQEIDLHFPGT